MTEDEMTEDRICELLTTGLEEIKDDEDGLEHLRVRTFEDAGVLTSNKGIVVRVGGIEFQITVVRSR